MRHAVFLSEESRRALSSADVLTSVPWVKVVPQLASRLDHWSPVVRKLALSVLQHVALKHSDTVLLAAVNLSNSNDAAATPSSPELRQLVGTLAQQRPVLFDEVAVLARDLQRLSVLWEESWLHLLVRVSAEAVKRLLKLHREARQVAADPKLDLVECQRLIQTKRAAALRSIVVPMERLLERTGKKVDNVNPSRQEQLFCERFLGRLQFALATFKDATSVSTSIKDAFEPFKQLHKDLSQLLHSSKHKVLQLGDVSPALASTRFTELVLPGSDGVVGADGEPVRVLSFEPEVTVLHTKTMPKKVYLRASDGRSYPFLVKGMEDLRLDERVMQWLRLTGDRLTQKLASTKASPPAQFANVRTYAVVPLSSSCGLIQWVEHATPLFTIFKRWQQRDALSKGVQVIDRPVDLYNRAIAQTLANQGLSLKTPRAQWPGHAMRRAFDDLESQIPANLLEVELWGMSHTVSSWWQRRQRFVWGGVAKCDNLFFSCAGLPPRPLSCPCSDTSSGSAIATWTTSSSTLRRYPSIIYFSAMIFLLAFFP